MLVMANELTALQQALLDALRDNGGWMTRKELGEAIGRKSGKLQHYDVQQLATLEDLGLIESQEVSMGAVMTGFQYRAIV